MIRLTLLLALIGLSSIHAATRVKLVEPVEYQVYFMLGQSLIQSSAFDPDSALINGREYDDQILSFWQGFDEVGNFGFRTLRNNSLQRRAGTAGPTSTGFDAGFARELYVRGERNIVIIRYAAGGHSVLNFLSPEKRLCTLPTGTSDRSELALDYFKTRLASLTKYGATYNLRGMIYWQGNADAGAVCRYTNYQAHLDGLKSDYRAIWPELKWLQVISPNWSGSTGQLAVQAAQRASAASDALAESVESDPALGVTVVYTDGTHPDAVSTERVAVQAARAFLSSFK